MSPTRRENWDICVCSREEVSAWITRLGAVLIGSHVDQDDPIGAAEAEGADWCRSSWATRRAGRSPSPATTPRR